MAAPINILVVEDNADLAEAMVDALGSRGHFVQAIESAEALAELTTLASIDIAVLDLNLPGEDGLSLARRLRAMQPGIGIIMFTARNLEDDRVVGFKSGADIYLAKPASLRELLAAIDALSRRLKPADMAVAIQLNVQARELKSADGQSIKLSWTELTILMGFIRASGQKLEHWQIVELLGKDVATYDLGAMQLHILRLRRKCQALGCGDILLPIRNWGYQLGQPIQLA